MNKPIVETQKNEEIKRTTKDYIRFNDHVTIVRSTQEVIRDGEPASDEKFVWQRSLSSSDFDTLKADPNADARYYFPVFVSHKGMEAINNNLVDIPTLRSIIPYLSQDASQSHRQGFEIYAKDLPDGVLDGLRADVFNIAMSDDVGNYELLYFDTSTLRLHFENGDVVPEAIEVTFRNEDFHFKSLNQHLLDFARGLSSVVNLSDYKSRPEDYENAHSNGLLVMDRNKKFRTNKGLRPLDASNISETVERDRDEGWTTTVYWRPDRETYQELLALGTHPSNLGSHIVKENLLGTDNCRYRNPVAFEEMGLLEASGFDTFEDLRAYCKKKLGISIRREVPSETSAILDERIEVEMTPGEIEKWRETFHERKAQGRVKPVEVMCELLRIQNPDPSQTQGLTR